MKNESLLPVLASLISFLLFTSLLCGTTVRQPDLIVSELTVKRVENSLAPLRVHVFLRIFNRGHDHTGSNHFVTRLYYRLRASDPWQTLHDFHSGPLAVGGGIHYENDFDFRVGGTYTFQAEVDANKVIAESVESDNVKMITKTLVAGTPDLVVTNLKASTVQVYANGHWQVKVEWDLRNSGDGKVQSSFVVLLKVYKDGDVRGAEMQRYARSNLYPGDSVHYAKTCALANVRSLRFKVIADSNDQINEKLEDNNSAQSVALTR